MWQLAWQPYTGGQDYTLPQTLQTQNTRFHPPVLSLPEKYYILVHICLTDVTHREGGPATTVLAGWLVVQL